MISPSELDVRFLSHAARIEYVNQFGALYPSPAPARRSPRRFIATLLLRLSIRPARQQARSTGASEAAVV